MALIDDIKLVLRISGSTYDPEISGLIAECKADLIASGILVTDDTDILTKRAITIYCKANFGFDNPDYERLAKAYSMHKIQMANSLDYAYFTVTITAVEPGIIIFDGVEKESNASGISIFHTRASDHVAYTVDGITAYIDISGDTTIGGE